MLDYSPKEEAKQACIKTPVCPFRVDGVVDERKIIMKPVVVRFAPSPTGYLHIGGARTAIFNWLFARQNEGKFILRIEDTDAERSTEDAIEGILRGLEWLGLDWDEGPDFQSRHVKAHRAAAEQLLESGHAYKCFCTKEELDRKREAARKEKKTYQYDGACRNLTPEEVKKREAAGEPYIIRLKVPRRPDAVVFEDKVFGIIEKRYEDIEDFVLVRANGQPLYVLANAVDDIRDGVTHIIRGQDGLANTPKQILIYQSLDAPLPVFAHMSLTLDPQKAKISKRRHGEQVAIHYYREHGFLPWAMVNFLTLLGWATTDSKEIFNPQELVQAFHLQGISRANSVFNIQPNDPKFFTDPKLININAHYLRNMPVEELFPFVKQQLFSAGMWDTLFESEKKEWFLKTVALIRERFHVLSDFTTLGAAYFSDTFPMDETAVRKNLFGKDAAPAWLVDLADQIDALTPFDAKSVEALLREFLKANNLKPGKLINAVRTAVTGQSKGPEFIEVLLCIGPERISRRLRRVAV